MEPKVNKQRVSFKRISSRITSSDAQRPFCKRLTASSSCLRISTRRTKSSCHAGTYNPSSKSSYNTQSRGFVSHNWVIRFCLREGRGFTKCFWDFVEDSGCVWNVADSLFASFWGIVCKPTVYTSTITPRKAVHYQVWGAFRWFGQAVDSTRLWRPKP